MRAIQLLIAVAIVAAAQALPATPQAQVLVNISVAPPALPVYAQPVIPGPDYMWVPGYWAWGPAEYYWVPGTWVLAPTPGLLWTPGYWGWRNGFYVWNAGYWGPRIGYYGGINYGFGYVGVGYAGGYWREGVFSYNRTTNNFGGVTINNTYNKTVINNTNVAQTSYNGGTAKRSGRPIPRIPRRFSNTAMARAASPSKFESVKSDEEWRRELISEQYTVLHHRHHNRP